MIARSPDIRAARDLTNVIKYRTGRRKIPLLLTRKLDLGSVAGGTLQASAEAHDYFGPGDALMKFIRTGLLALCLPFLLAAAPVKTSVKTHVKAWLRLRQDENGRQARGYQKATSRLAADAAAPVQTKARSRHKRPKPSCRTDAAADAPKTYPLQSIAFPGGVTMTQMVYRTLPGFRPLTVDVYQTNEKSFPRSGLIFVHGGNWVGGDPRHNGTFGDWPGLLASLAARGYVVASVDYRLSGEAHFPAALQDVKSAISWLRGHGDEFNLDQTRVAIWGASAGGQLASLAGVSCGVAALEPPSATQR